MRADEYIHLDAKALGRLIANREVSPVEVIDACLSRLGAVEPSINAFVSTDEGGAQRAAKAAERQILSGAKVGPLHGVPISIKDLIDVRDMSAHYGSLTFKHNVAFADAPSVERLRRAGAIIIGKTATSEFGARGYTVSRLHGNTKNPWSLAHTPGGSSGGAAASVAAGVTPFSLGTDGGGSIRAPAALTGLVGIKATFGRVPVWPASATPTLAHVGPLARTVGDAELLLKVIAGADPRDQFSFLPSMGRAVDPKKLSAMRVAFAPIMGYGKVDAAVDTVVKTAISKLRTLFPKIEPIDVVCDEAADAFAIEFAAGCAARLGALKHSPDDLDPVLRASLERFRARPAQEIAEALRYRYRIKDQIAALFQQYDLLMTPTVPCVAWDADKGVPPGHEHETAWSYFTYPFNLTGQPAGTLPCGQAADGMPVGLQIVAPLCREDLLLTAMKAAETLVSTGFGTSIDPRR
jgi:aspartyl-tRNA(Asn)/glutamyl-tRNA(Gln) amidotransferase subunit A